MEITESSSIDWRGWPDVILVHVARVHHGPDGPVTKGIKLHAVRPGNPAAAMSEPRCADLVPSYAGGFQLGVSLSDALGDLGGQEFGIRRVGHGPETEIHDARGAVGVGRGDEDPVGRDARFLGDQFLRFIANGAGDHAAIHDSNRDARLAPLKNEATGLEVARIHFSAPSLGESSADYVRVEGTCHVLNIGPGPQGWFRAISEGGKRKPQTQHAGHDHASETGGNARSSHAN